MLKTLFKVSQEFLNSNSVSPAVRSGSVALGRVDCDKNPIISKQIQELYPIVRSLAL